MEVTRVNDLNWARHIASRELSVWKTNTQHILALKTNSLRMGKLKDLRDHVNQLDHKHEQSAKVLASKIDQHARRIRVDLDRESKVFAMRIVKLEKRIAVLERRVRKAK